MIDEGLLHFTRMGQASKLGVPDFPTSVAQKYPGLIEPNEKMLLFDPKFQSNFNVLLTDSDECA